MPSIAIMTAHARFPWLRQIASGSDAVGQWRFTLNAIDADCEFVVVYDDPASAFVCPLPRQRRLLITSEPPGIKTYREPYLAQFGVIFGPVGEAGSGQKLIRSHPALPWFYGVGFEPAGLVANETIDTLMAMEPPEKQAAISVILSKKSQLPKHRARLAFVEAARARLGDRLQVFGRGFRDVRDKAEAIRPFAYHLVLENNDLPHFWTEKTADAFLGWALPIFSGTSEIGRDFPEGSFLPLDISRKGAALDRLEEILKDDPWQAHLPAIRSARLRLMTEHNLFPLLAKQADSLGPMPELLAERESIRPNADFAFLSGMSRLANSLGSRARQALGRKQGEKRS